MKMPLQIFADLLSYPRETYPENARTLLNCYSESSPERGQLSAFYDFAVNTDLRRIEEVFTETFDMNKTACLELGWHLYGEDYARGEFLVKMRQSLQEYQIEESVELPDHISHCLLLLAALDSDDAAIFAANYISPALATILKGFSEDNPYYGLLTCLQDVLQKTAAAKPELLNA